MSQEQAQVTTASPTPGPWCFVEDNGGLYRVETTTGAHVTDYVIGEANARLIAAAPDLLEALRGMLDRFAPDDDGLGEAEIACAARARAAIARAEGR